MAVTPQPAFTIDAAVGASFGSSSSAVALPGTLGSDTVVKVTNLGPCHLAVAFGSSGVTTTNSGGCVVPAGQTVYFGLGTATHMAGVSCGGPGTTTMVNVATGN